MNSREDDCKARARMQYDSESSSALSYPSGRWWPVRRKRRYIWSMDELLALCRMAEQELSDSAIAEELGKNVYAVRTRRMQMDVGLRAVRRRKRELALSPIPTSSKREREDAIRELVARFEGDGIPRGMWTRRISAALGIKGGTAKSYLKRLGLWQ